MAQADLNVANQSGSAFRADLNNQLLALGTLMSGASEPSTTYAYMLWADTTADVLKMRNAANNGWIILRGLEGKLSVGSSAPGANVNFRLNRDIAGGTTSFGQYLDANVAASVTTSAIGIGTNLGTAASASLSSLIHYQAATGTLGAGTNITNQIGFSASSSIDGATNDFGFYGNIAAGSGNWNCYMVGAAPSFFNHQVQIAAGSAGTPAVSTNGDTDTGVYFPSANALSLVTGGADRIRLDSTGRVGIGTTTPQSILDIRKGGTSTTPTLVLSSGSAGDPSTVDPSIQFAASGAESVGTTKILSTGSLNARALAFHTGADGAGTEKVRITSGGTVRIGTTVDVLESNGEILSVVGGASSFNRVNGTVHRLNRSNDGQLVAFYSGGTEQGGISVSGTTVSYNGAHLSRWSQIPGVDAHDKDRRPEILRGTVMSNLDEMCDWVDPASLEAQDNEQLNKTKISDIEGDINVAGVFEAWDDDDAVWVNDYYLAMSGDFVIRIAQGVTVARGDLLMSAGDGTAKPQGDGYVQDKTIAKVISTTVSVTHPDGSYCVPCVLMTC